jgi:hypothetical protein
MGLGQKAPDCHFWHYSGQRMRKMADVTDDFAAFAEQWNNLPPDPYLTNGNPFRFRRHARVIFDADADAMEILPPGGYRQASENNSLFGGITRRFAPVEWTSPATRLVTALVRTSVIDVLGLPGRNLVNLHQVRIVGGPEHAGTPVPEGPHKDGFDFISIHLIDRDVDGGGETALFSEDGNTTKLTLTERMESVYVNDRRMSHDTSSIDGHNRQVHRDVLLMSFERAS